MKLGICPEFSVAYAAPFDVVFDETKILNSEKDVDGCDAILLWGGTDIAPIFYGEEPHPLNQCQTGPSARDMREFACMTRAHQLGIAIIGICRGAQFICAFGGGKLIQDMSGHSGRCLIQWGNEVYQQAEDHHQAMEPPGDAEVLAFAQHDGTPEVVLFPNIRALAIQGHPEWMSSEAPFVTRVLQEVNLLMQSVVQPETVEE